MLFIKNKINNFIVFFVAVLFMLLPILSRADNTTTDDRDSDNRMLVPIVLGVGGAGLIAGIGVYAAHHRSDRSDNTPNINPKPTPPTPTPDPTTNVILEVPKQILLIPGWTMNVAVKNTSPIKIAENVEIKFPDTFDSDIESIDNTNCHNILPNAICNIKVVVKDIFGAKQSKPMLLSSTTNDAVIQGSNTDPVTTVFDIKPGVELNSTVINEPTSSNNPNNFIINNNSDGTVTINSLKILGDINGVSVDQIVPANCKSIAANSSCAISLIATNSAYGQGEIKVDYTTPYDEPKTVSNTLTVAKTNLNLLDVNNKPISEIELEVGKIPQFIKINVQNNGNFNWNNANFTWPNGTIDNVMLVNDELHPNTCMNSSLASKDVCSFWLEVNPSAQKGDNKILRIAGDNIDSIDTNVLVTDRLVIMPDTDYLHLGYRAIKVKNATDAAINITNIKVTNNNSDKIYYCLPNDNNCFYKDKTASICAAGTNLNAKDSCLIWFKALPISGVSQKQIVPISVTVEADSDFKNHVPEAIKETENFNFDYENDLYVSGYFTTADGKTANHVARWDGNVWSSVGDGVNSNVWAITTTASSDIYVAGQFTAAGKVAANNIAKWNGSVWKPLGNGTDSYIYTLSDNASGDLYVGGQFKNADGKLVNGVAKWNDITSSWDALGNGVNNIVNWITTTLHGEIYLGVDSSASFAKWNNTTSTWDKLGADKINYSTCWPTPYWYINSVTALTKVFSESNDIYIGGCFTVPTNQNVTANYIAKWDETAATWTSLGNGKDNGTNNLVDALTLGVNDSKILYVGGMFTKAGNFAANYIAKWDGNAWSPLGNSTKNGVNNTVWALEATPNADLYVSGQFTSATDATKSITANYIARWDESSMLWSSLGKGTNGIVAALVVAPAIAISGPITK